MRSGVELRQHVQELQVDVIVHSLPELLPHLRRLVNLVYGKRGKTLLLLGVGLLVGVEGYVIEFGLREEGLLVEVLLVADPLVLGEVPEGLEAMAVFALLLAKHTEPLHVELANRGLLVDVLASCVLLDDFLVQPDSIVLP